MKLKASPFEKIKKKKTDKLSVRIIQKKKKKKEKKKGKGEGPNQ